MGTGLDTEAYRDQKANIDRAAAEKERNRKLRIRGKSRFANPHEEVYNFLRTFKGPG
jgi:hypothetical protein